VKPIAGTDSCQVPRPGYFICGRMTVEMEDGERLDYGPGDLPSMAPRRTRSQVAFERPALSSAGGPNRTRPPPGPR
jgi:hypothetical protein